MHAVIRTSKKSGSVLLVDDEDLTFLRGGETLVIFFPFVCSREIYLWEKYEEYIHGPWQMKAHHPARAQARDATEFGAF